MYHLVLWKEVSAQQHYRRQTVFTLETLFQGFTSFFLVASTVWIAAATATAAVALRVFPFSIFPLFFFWAVSLLKQELTGDSSSSISACALVCLSVSFAGLLLLSVLAKCHFTFFAWRDLWHWEEEGEEGEEWCAAFSFTFFCSGLFWPFDDDYDGTFVCHWLLWLIVQLCQSVSVCVCALELTVQLECCGCFCRSYYWLIKTVWQTWWW